MTGKWLVLAGSLLINVALAAYIVTGELRPPPVPPGAEVGGFAELRAISDMPPEVRKSARALIRTRLPEVRGARQVTQERFQEFQEQLAAIPFDRAAMDSAADALADARRTQWRLAADVFLDVLEGLPDTQREALLERRAAATGDFQDMRRGREEQIEAPEREGDR